MMSNRSGTFGRVKRCVSVLTAFAAILAACGCLCACGRQTAASMTVRLTGILGDQARGEIYRGVLTDFSREHPSVYLRDITTGEEDAFKLELNIAGSYSKSDSPHVIYYYNNADMRQLADYFVPVQEIREDFPDFLPDIGDNALECAAWDDGKTYCIPVMGDWYAIAVNKPLLAKFGLDVPSDWNSLLRAVDVLSANQVIPFANSAEDSAVFIESLVRSVGGQSSLRYGIEGDEAALSGVWTQALTYYQELCARNAFAPAAYTSAISGYALPPSVYDGVLGADRDKTRRLDPVNLFTGGSAAMIALDRQTFMKLDNRDDTVLIDLPAAGQNSLDDASYASSPAFGASGSDTAGGVSPADADNISGVSAAGYTEAPLPDRLYGGYTEGFYITRKAYTDPSLRPLIVELLSGFASAGTEERFSALGYLVPNTQAKAQLPQLERTYEAAAAGASYLQSTTGGVNSARWSYINQCAVQLWYGLITPARMSSLLCDESRNAIDVLEQVEQEQEQESVSPSDAE